MGEIARLINRIWDAIARWVKRKPTLHDWRQAHKKAQETGDTSELEALLDAARD